MELAGSRVLTNSRIGARQTCQRLEQLKYQLGYRAVRRAHALGFGSLIHDGLEAWSKAERGDAQLDAALAVLEAAAKRGMAEGAPVDPYDAVRARVMLTGYHFRWVDEDLEWLAVEQKWSMPLRNPKTGKASRLWTLEGKFDGVVRRISNGHVHVVERKTSGEDIGVGSTYWSALTLDNQVSMYLDAARANGHDARGVLYDVLGKPKLDPYKATPVEERRYTERASKLKDGTVRPAGSLHSNQRERDEAPAEFEVRLTGHVAANPDRYYRRGEIVRLDDEVQELRVELWQIAQQLRESQRTGQFPRNAKACRQYGRMCDFWPVCARQGSLHDTLLYRRVDHVHPELVDESEVG